MNEERSPPPTRRSFLQAAAWGALTVTALSAMAIRATGYPQAPSSLVVLSNWQHALLVQVARRMVASDSDSAPSPDELDVAGFIDRSLVPMPSDVKRDLGRLFVYVEQLAPMACGFASRFTKLDAASQDVVLASLESSRIHDLRGGFSGLKALVMMGYYRSPKAWALLGYEGPTLSRPQ